MEGAVLRHGNGYLRQLRGPGWRPPKLPADLERRVLELAVGAAFMVPCHELSAPTRRKASIAFARQVAMYMAHVAYGRSLTEAGALFGRDRTTAAHACGIVEDRRDDPRFDAILDHLECALIRLASTVAAVNA